MSFIKKIVSLPTHASSSDVLFGLPLDLTYITPNIIVCSFPTSHFPMKLFRNSFNDLTHFLNISHGSSWKIWNLRAESTIDYLPKNASNLNYSPWPDHEAPPFQLLSNIIDSVQSFLSSDSNNVAVIHCKLGKGRSGLVVVSYLIKYLGIDRSKADALFTKRRMRFGFGRGVSILSQQRYISYVEMNTLLPYNPNQTYTLDFIKIINPYFANLESFKVGLQYYDETNSLSEKLWLVIDHDFIPEAQPLPVCIIRFSISPSISRQEYRLSFQFNNSKTGIPLSRAYIWFNLFWESLRSPNGRCTFAWKDFDGFKGTSKKGSKLFDRIDIFYAPRIF